MSVPPNDVVVTSPTITIIIPPGTAPTNIPTVSPTQSPTESPAPTKARPREYQSLKPFEVNLYIPDGSSSSSNSNNNSTTATEPAVIDISEVDRLTTKHLTGYLDLQLNQGVSDYSTFGYVSLSINYFRVKSESSNSSGNNDAAPTNYGVRRRHRRLANQIAEASFTGSSVFYGTNLPDKKIMHQLEADAFQGESLDDFLALLQTSYDEVLASVTNVTVIMETPAEPVITNPIDDGDDSSSSEDGMTILYVGIAASVVIVIVALTVMYVWRNRRPNKFSAGASRGSNSRSASSAQSRREQTNTDATSGSSPQPLMQQASNQASGRYYGNYQEETESVIQETQSVISGKSYDYSMDGFSLANRSGVPKAGDDKSVYSEMPTMDDMSLLTGIIERKDSGNLETLLLDNGSKGSFMDDAATFVNQQDDESTWSFSKVAGSKSMSPSNAAIVARKQAGLPNDDSIATGANDGKVFDMTRPVAQMSMSKSLEENTGARNALSFPPHMTETQGTSSYETMTYTASMSSYPTHGAQSFPPHLGQDNTYDPSGTFDPSRAESYLEPTVNKAKSEDDAISLSTIDLEPSTRRKKTNMFGRSSKAKAQQTFAAYTGNQEEKKKKNKNAAPKQQSYQSAAAAAATSSPRAASPRATSPGYDSSPVKTNGRATSPPEYGRSLSHRLAGNMGSPENANRRTTSPTAQYNQRASSPPTNNRARRKPVSPPSDIPSDELEEHDQNLDNFSIDDKDDDRKASLGESGVIDDLDRLSKLIEDRQKNLRKIRRDRR